MHCCVTAADICYFMLGTIKFVDKIVNDNSFASEVRCAAQWSWTLNQVKLIYSKSFGIKRYLLVRENSIGPQQYPYKFKVTQRWHDLHGDHLISYQEWFDSSGDIIANTIVVISISHSGLLESRLYIVFLLRCYAISTLCNLQPCVVQIICSDNSTVC